MSKPAPVAHLSRRYRFSASHRLHVDQLTDDRNRELFGKCNNPFGHGHNYTVQITVAGPIDAHSGMVVNLGDMDDFVRREVLERFDQVNLNTDEAFARCVPSTENLATVLWQLLAPFAAAQASLRLVRVRVEETYNNAFDYFGGGDGLSRVPVRPMARIGDRPQTA